MFTLHPTRFGSRPPRVRRASGTSDCQGIGSQRTIVNGVRSSEGVPSSSPEWSLGAPTRCLWASVVGIGFWVGVTGCGESEAWGPRTGALSDSSGIQIVVHPPLGRYGSRAQAVEYLWEVPESAGGGPVDFGFVGDVELLPDGRIAVLDQYAANIRVFSAPGELVHTLGRRGPGPGELSGEATLGLILSPSGDLVVPDVINRAFVIFGVDGRYRENVPFDFWLETTPLWRRVSGDTVMVLVQGQQEDVFVRRTLSGDVRDTVLVLLAPQRGPSPSDGRWPILTDEVLWDAGEPNTLVVAHVNETSLTVVQGGRTRRIIRWKQERMTLSEAEANALLSIAARSMGDESGNPDNARNHMTTPPFRPQIAAVGVGNGFVMAQRPRAIGEMDTRVLSTMGPLGIGGPLWDVFSWSGRFVGTADFGSNVEVFRVRGDTIVGVREDEVGLQHPFVALLPPAFRNLSLEEA